MATQAPTMDNNLYYRISDLPGAAPITGQEVVEALQAGKNVKFLLSQLMVAGKSAYDVAREQGFQGNVNAWLASLVGTAGKDGTNGTNGVNGEDGKDGEAGQDGVNGIDGLSALEILKEAFPESFPIGTPDEQSLLALLKGPAGDKGDQGASGVDGQDGVQGLSALEVLKEAQPEAFPEDQDDVVSLAALLRGEKGDKGDQGQNGVSGESALQTLKTHYPEAFPAEEDDEQSMRALLRGPTGTGTRIAGYVESESDLPDPTEASDFNYAYYVGTNLFIPIDGVWEDFGDFAGPEGLGLNIRGSLPTMDFLPITNNEKGDTFIITDTKTMHVWDTEKWSEVGQVGPAGEDAFSMAKKNGFEGDLAMWLESMRGPQGEQGEQGEKGEAANSLRILGRKETTGDLPAEGAVIGDAWFVDRNVFAYDGEEWTDCGELYAKSNYDLAVEEGFVGTVQEYLETIMGVQGEKGDKGEQGEQGVTGPSLRMLGPLEAVEALPEAAEFIGDAYLIAGNTWVFGADGWFDAGVFRGPQGAEGPRGLLGPKGDVGNGLKIVGEVANMAALPKSTAESPIEVGTAYVQTDQNKVFIYGIAGWFDGGPLRGAEGKQGIQGLKGDAGPRGYTGSTGSTGLRGPQGYTGLTGPRGYTGPVGKDLIITGRLTSSTQLPAGKPLGTAYVIYDAEAVGERVWIYGEAGWFDAGILKGAQGDKGATGNTGVKGDKGDRGEALDLQGTKATVSELPANALPGQSWLVDGNIHLRTEDGYANLGPLRGPQGLKGDTGNTGAKGDVGERGQALSLMGTQPSVAALPAGEANGNSWLVNGDIHLKTAGGYVNLGPLRGQQGEAGVQGIKGDKGDKGDQGQGLNLLGRKATSDLLPSTGSTLGDAWMVGTVLWIFGVNGWFQAGSIAGVSAYDIYLKEAGSEPMTEAEWLASLRGLDGEKGDVSAAISVLGSKQSVADLPTEGEPGDAYIIGTLFYVRTEDGNWESIGGIVGPRGEKGAQGDTGKQGIQGLRGLRGEQGRSVLLGAYDPTAGDGAIGDVFMNTNTQGVWIKTTLVLWNFVGNFGGGNVFRPADPNKTYVWRNGWVEFDRYNVAIQPSTGVCDLNIANIFSLDNTTAGTRTVAFANLPTGRATTIVVKVMGKVGTVNWPAGVMWNAATAPELKDTLTNVVFLYDGAALIGTVGASL